MYIKFCRSYAEDKKDEAGENLSSKLSVELGAKKDKEQTEGNARLYRAACLFLTLICIVLLVVVIILGLKLQTGSTACPVTEETIPADQRGCALAPACTFERCQARFPAIHIKHIGCKQCAEGWLTFGRSCFFLSTFRLRWSESQQNCTSRGGSLAVITSKDVQDFLTKKGNLQYWIGTSQKGTEWTWVDNTELQESYWAENPWNGNCGILDSTAPADKNWFRAPCHSATYFICQLQF
ncbi:C-type lectin domain family 4 member E isoform X2 [Archocentrus centrarchus]|uniref:C-type lectin domain family 4 member E isoform X2 n=1 Tax=Archocentrus centrarchus TaxID=63155 RepID=UPI0011EA4B4D|nr:C-type lectin domain family 4 member E-like isoform X2 [Archocentrus centrarchus]